MSTFLIVAAKQAAWLRSESLIRSACQQANLSLQTTNRQIAADIITAAELDPAQLCYYILGGEEDIDVSDALLKYDDDTVDGVPLDEAAARRLEPLVRLLKIMQTEVAPIYVIVSEGYDTSYRCITIHAPDMIAPTLVQAYESEGIPSIIFRLE